MSATFGRTSPKQFAFYDPDGSCWRTWPAISLWGSETFSGTWPKRGSMRNGACFEHPTWAPATSEPDCSSLLPTPTASQPGGTAEQHLARKNRMADGARRTSVTDLRMALSLLPTPVVNDMGEGKTPDRWDEWTAEMKGRHGNGNGHGRSLAIEAQRLLPTPRASDGPDESSHARTWSATDFNLHSWVREQIHGIPTRRSSGASTSPPSDAGSSPSDGPPPDLLTMLDDSPPHSSSG